jgi:hypothetical protein
VGVSGLVGGRLKRKFRRVRKEQLVVTKLEVNRMKRPPCGNVLVIFSLRTDQLSHLNRGTAPPSGKCAPTFSHDRCHCTGAINSADLGARVEEDRIG